MPPERTGFYPARFVLRWAIDQTEELRSSVSDGPTADRLRGESLPLALGIVTNYRMVAEHVAHEVARAACPYAQPERVSFPVALDAVAFRSMMTTRFPGLRFNAPKAWTVLRRNQAFAPENDGWLLDLHRLWNRTYPIEVSQGPDAASEKGARLRGSEPRRVGPSLVYDGRRSVADLLVRIGPAETRMIDDLERVLTTIEPPTGTPDRRDRR